jgi:hypothetical protein
VSLPGAAVIARSFKSAVLAREIKKRFLPSVERDDVPLLCFAQVEPAGREEMKVDELIDNRFVRELENGGLVNWSMAAFSLLVTALLG